MDIHIKLTIDDRLVRAARWFSRKLSVRRAGLLALVCTLSFTVVVMADQVARPHTFGMGDRITADAINESFDVVYDELNARVIRNDTIFEVADCVALKAALASLDDRLITSNATVTFELPEGDFPCGGRVTIDHRDGGHIQIKGQGPDATSLTFQAADGFLVPPGRRVGFIDAMTIRGDGFAGAGIHVQAAAVARVGEGVVIREFKHGLHAESGVIRAEGVRCEDNEEFGIYAELGGVIDATDSTSNNNKRDGYASWLGSTIVANGASATGNMRYGFNADLQSAILAADGPVASGSLHGFNANDNSTIATFSPTASDNSAFGFAAWNSGLINAVNPVSSDNAVGYGQRFGSFQHLVAPTGNSTTYLGPGANVFFEAEMCLMFVE